MDLQGKVAIVTGGASGIGLAFVKALLQSGVRVAMCDVNKETAEIAMKDLIAQFGKDKIIFIQTDVTQESQIEDAFNKTKLHFKRLDILLNNAGILDDNHWEREIDVNLKGVFRGILLAFKHLGKHNGGDGGVVVNVASVTGFICFETAPMYSATKAAVVNLSRTLGAPSTFDKTGVRVVALCPSTTETPLYEQMESKLLFSDWIERYQEDLKLFVFVKPEVVAQSLLQVLRQAETGSVWVSEGEETYAVNMPDHQAMRI